MWQLSGGGHTLSSLQVFYSPDSALSPTSWGLIWCLFQKVRDLLVRPIRRRSCAPCDRPSCPVLPTPSFAAHWHWADLHCGWVRPCPRCCSSSCRVVKGGDAGPALGHTLRWVFKGWLQGWGGCFTTVFEALTPINSSSLSWNFINVPLCEHEQRFEKQATEASVPAQWRRWLLASPHSSGPPAVVSLTEATSMVWAWQLFFQTDHITVLAELAVLSYLITSLPIQYLPLCNSLLVISLACHVSSHPFPRMMLLGWSRHPF